MAFSDAGSRTFYSPIDDADTKSQTSQSLRLHSTTAALKQHNTHELLHPLTVEDEQELLSVIRHSVQQQQPHTAAHQHNKCCVCGITVSSQQNIKVDVSAKHKGQETFRAVFHLHCMPLLWQTMLLESDNKQKYPVCRGTEGNDDVATLVADVPTFL